MAADLFGNPLGKLPEYQLALWQKRQATLLYHYTSKEYLNEIRNALQLFCLFCDGTLDKTLADNLDRFMTTEGWDMRERPANWSIYTHPMLGELMRRVNVLKGRQISGIYGETGVSGTFRGRDEYSMPCVSPAQYECYEKLRRDVTNIADRLDFTVDRSQKDSLLACI